MNTYPYKNLPLTPSIMKELIKKNLSGEIIERKDIVNIISELHIKQGGKESNAANLPRSFKKALSKLKEEGIAININYGYWEIRSEQYVLEQSSIKLESEAEKDEELNDDTDFAEEIIGKGKSIVYAYYFPVYKMLAKIYGQNFWEIKIGYTERSPIERIYSQASTALPEIPKIALAIKTNEPKLLEKTIRTILEYNGKKIDDVPGNEWFHTSPDEIKEIYAIIMKKKFEKGDC